MILPLLFVLLSLVLRAARREAAAARRLSLDEEYSITLAGRRQFSDTYLLILRDIVIISWGQFNFDFVLKSIFSLSGLECTLSASFQGVGAGPRESTVLTDWG